PFPPDALANLFGAPPTTITLDGCETLLRDVHAVRANNVIAYAVIAEGRMTVLGLDPVARFVIEGDVASRLEQFVREHRLEPIHWRSRTRLASADAVMKYPRGNG